MRTHAERARTGAQPGERGAPPARRLPGGAAPSPADPSVPAPAPALTPGVVLQLQAAAGNRATRGVVVQRAISWSQAEAVARQIEDAVSGLGTDEEAIYGALAGRTADDMADIRNIYRQLFGETLDEALRDDLTDEEMERVRPVLEARPEASMGAGERAVAAMDAAAGVADQLHDAMEGLGTDEDQIFNALTGRTPAEIEEISRQYAARYPNSLEDDLRDDLSGDDLARALRLIGREDAGTFENALQQRMTEGATTVVRGRFNYTLSEDTLEVDVPAHFVPAEGVEVPLDTWNGQVDDIWNQFAITEPGGRRVDVHMALRDDSGDPRTINVVENSTPGEYGYPDRANAGKWYPVMPDSTAPHEFGHLIGLPDEYQRTADDFEAITGETKTGPENESGKTEEEIAEELHTALTVEDVAQRAPGATTVLRNRGLIAGGIPQQGDFAQAVMAAYNEAHGETAANELLPTLQGLPAGTNWTLLTVFSFASGTVMGNPAVVGTQEHEHPVMARHLREFKSIVWNRWPSLDWQVE
jgi:hypothetical protein